MKRDERELFWKSAVREKERIGPKLAGDRTTKHGNGNNTNLPPVQNRIKNLAEAAFAAVFLEQKKKQDSGHLSRSHSTH